MLVSQVLIRFEDSRELLHESEAVRLLLSLLLPNHRPAVWPACRVGVTHGAQLKQLFNWGGGEKTYSFFFFFFFLLLHLAISSMHFHHTSREKQRPLLLLGCISAANTQLAALLCTCFKKGENKKLNRGQSLDLLALSFMHRSSTCMLERESSDA